MLPSWNHSKDGGGHGNKQRSSHHATEVPPLALWATRYGAKVMGTPFAPQVPPSTLWATRFDVEAMGAVALQGSPLALWASRYDAKAMGPATKDGLTDKRSAAIIKLCFMNSAVPNKQEHNSQHRASGHDPPDETTVSAAACSTCNLGKATRRSWIIIDTGAQDNLCGAGWADNHIALVDQAGRLGDVMTADSDRL